MTVQLNHTIVWARDQKGSARFVADILGLPAPQPFGPFQVVSLDNDVSLDFLAADQAAAPQHYAFLVTEREFDEIFARIRDRSVTYWADPFHRYAGEINTNDGGRGVYFSDPEGHNLEVITRPYGGG
jgi:catechol 2,3-dioxygenase-like lactoylglutathione lyase family enzyme